MTTKTILGRTYKDKITGFEGVCTGRCEYITGCNQALIQPVGLKDGNRIESSWFDEQRLDVTDAEIIVLDNGTTPGADKAAPRI